MPPVEGSRRRKHKRSESEDEDEVHRNPQHKTRCKQTFAVGEVVEIWFDGACRGNGMSNVEVKSSTGVFVQSYGNLYSLGKLCAAHTNQQAEIVAAIRAGKTVLELAGDHRINCFIIRGDSNHVISSIYTGRWNNYTASCRLPNASLWFELKCVIQQLLDAGIDVKWLWVPRAKNKEADELCNACLDDRQPNVSIVSLLECPVY